MKHIFYFLFLFLPFGLFAQVTPQANDQKVQENRHQEKSFAWLMIRTDYPAEVIVNGNNYGKLKAGRLKKVPAVKGDNLVQLFHEQEDKQIEKLIVLSEGEQNSSKLIEMFFDAPPTAVANRKKIPENMVYVEGGTFMMGNEDGSRNERPEHEVLVNSFYIGKHEVTVAQYREFCIATGHDMPNEPDEGWEDNKPIVNVSWYDAMDYCKWMGGRLPTEAEWEYAARGGKLAEQDWKYSGSNDPLQVAWTRKNSEGYLKEVMQLEPNALGLYDMSGNAWEWVLDNYKTRYYKKSPKDNPRGPGKSPFRVLRGGSWATMTHNAEVTHRYNFSGKGWHKTFGFRLLIPSEENKAAEKTE